jgi:hypothetical protein
MSDENERSVASAGSAIARETLPAKAIQIQATSHPGHANCGPHVLLYALCDDGSIWVQYESDGRANVPTDGLWRRVEGGR